MSVYNSDEYSIKKQQGRKGQFYRYKAFPPPGHLNLTATNRKPRATNKAPAESDTSGYWELFLTIQINLTMQTVFMMTHHR